MYKCPRKLHEQGVRKDFCGESFEMQGAFLLCIRGIRSLTPSWLKASIGSDYTQRGSRGYSAFESLTYPIKGPAHAASAQKVRMCVAA